MDKLKMHSLNATEQNIARVASLFPNCVTEGRDAQGQPIPAIDFDLLRQELSAQLVEGPQERYQLNWPGKREALLTANAPIAKTLRPCRAESVDFDTTQNLFIEGDNLDALKLLQETYLGKVKMIYIDPPYNTGSDLLYDDDFTESIEQYLIRSSQQENTGNRLVVNAETNGRFHSDWLSMMYSRLKIARNLLKSDGMIFISIDDGEVSNLRKICDEIFGYENFIANIVWQKKTSPDARMNISAAHDHILLYGKEVNQSRLAYLPFEEERRNSFSNPDNDPRGDWVSVDLTGQTGRAPRSQFYTITTPSGIDMAPPEGRCWALAEKTFIELVKDNRIWFGESGSNRPRLKKFLSESQGTRPWTWWDNKSVGHNQESSQELKLLFDDKVVFDNPKPTRLINRIIDLAVDKDKNEIILDFFAGSGTTAHAVYLCNSKDNGNRRFILVQLPQDISVGLNDFKASSTAYKLGYTTISEITKERIRRAGQKIKADHAEKPGIDDLDIGFRVLKVDSSNMKDVYYRPEQVGQAGLFDQVDVIKDDRTGEDLLFQVMLELGVELTLPIQAETLAGHTVYRVDDNAIVACFDDAIDENLVRAIADKQPLRAVFRDAGFAYDSAKINAAQIFKQFSPTSELKTL